MPNGSTGILARHCTIVLDGGGRQPTCDQNCEGDKNFHCALPSLEGNGRDTSRTTNVASLYSTFSGKTPTRNFSRYFAFDQISNGFTTVSADDRPNRRISCDDTKWHGTPRNSGAAAAELGEQ